MKQRENLIETSWQLDNIISNVEQERMCPAVFLTRQRRSLSCNRGITSKSCVQR